MRKLISPILAALLLAGCAQVSGPAATSAGGSTAPAASRGDPLQELAAFTVTDLQNADAIATASGDDIAHACYPALVKFVQSLPSASPSTTVSGAISAFETLRATRLKTQGVLAAGVPSYLKLGCAALVQDETVFITKLAALAGGGGALGPLAPGLLPMINSALPIPLP